MWLALSRVPFLEAACGVVMAVATAFFCGRHSVFLSLVRMECGGAVEGVMGGLVVGLVRGCSVMVVDDFRDEELWKRLGMQLDALLHTASCPLTPFCLKSMRALCKPLIDALHPRLMALLILPDIALRGAVWWVDERGVVEVLLFDTPPLLLSILEV